MTTWLHAFLLTQAIEIPLYLWAGRRVALCQRWLAAAGASAVTHPVLWFCFPWDRAPYVQCLVAGESFVVFTEAFLLAQAGYRRPLAVSLMVNAASAAAGLALHALLQ
jgi:hypothetical protein